MWDYTIGHTSYYRSASVIKKAIAVTPTKGMNVNDYFHLTVEIVRLDSRAYGNVENFHLLGIGRTTKRDNYPKKTGTSGSTKNV